MKDKPNSDASLKIKGSKNDKSKKQDPYFRAKMTEIN